MLDLKKFKIVFFCTLLLGLFLAGCMCRYVKEASVWEDYSDGCYSPSKNKIVFAKYCWVYRSLANECDAYTKDCSPTKLVIRDFDLLILDVETNELQKISTIEGQPMGFPPTVYISWQQDLIAYYLFSKEGTKNIYLFKPDGSSKRKLISNGSNPELSKDAKRVAYLKEDEVWIIDTNNTKNEYITSLTKLAYVKWKDENTLFLYTFKPYEIYEFNLTTSKLKKTNCPYLRHYGMISHKEIKKMLAPTQIDYQQTRKKKNTNKTTNNLQENKKTALKEKPQKAMHIKKKKHEKEIVSGTGTVEYINIEGGFYGIIAEDGTHYLPANLNKEFHVDGLRIEFTAETCEDTISFYMWGIPVEIIEINKLK